MLGFFPNSGETVVSDCSSLVATWCIYASNPWSCSRDSLPSSRSSSSTSSDDNLRRYPLSTKLKQQDQNGSHLRCGHSGRAEAARGLCCIPGGIPKSHERFDPDPFHPTRGIRSRFGHRDSGWPIERLLHSKAVLELWLDLGREQPRVLK